MRKIVSQQIPLKSRGSLENIFESLYSNKLENLEEMKKTSKHIRPTKISPRGYK
jgi:hypothetical protein